MCLLSMPVTPGEWFCSSCQGWPDLCSPLDSQSPEVIPLFSCPNQSPNEEANTLSTQRAGAAFPLLAALRSSLLPWGQAALLVCRIRLHQCHHTKIWFAGKLRSRYPISLLTHKQQAFHLCKKKKKKQISKILKTTTEKGWTMQILQMPSPSSLQLVWQGASAVPGRYSHNTVHIQLLCIPCKLSTPAVWLYPYPGTALNKSASTPWSDPDTRHLPQLNQRVEILHLWKFSWNSIFKKNVSLNRAPFVCSVDYPAPNHTST